MKFFRRSSFLRLVVLPFALTLWLSACYKWTALETSGDSTELPSPVRLTLTDGRQFELEGATIVGDTIVGMRRGSDQPGQIAEQVRLSVAEVQKAEHKEKDELATAAALSPVALLLGILISNAFTDFACGNFCD